MTEEVRAWQSVLEHIESRLLSGDLVPGDRLPGERALAAELGVGRSSVREAIRVLEVLGLIRTSSGSGPNAGAIIVSIPGGGMSALMRLQIAAQGFRVADIVQTRLILETEVVSLLSDTTPDLSAALRLLGAMDDPRISTEAFLALDTQFHLALCEALDNHVLTATMAGLRGSIESYALIGAQNLPSWKETSTRLRHEHHEIADAIRAGDAKRARRATRNHIHDYYTESMLAPETAAPATADPR